MLNRSADLSVSRHQSVRSAKSVYNLLTLVITWNFCFFFKHRRRRTKNCEYTVLNFDLFTEGGVESRVMEKLLVGMLFENCASTYSISGKAASSDAA